MVDQDEIVQAQAKVEECLQKVDERLKEIRDETSKVRALVAGLMHRKGMQSRQSTQGSEVQWESQVESRSRDDEMDSSSDG